MPSSQSSLCQMRCRGMTPAISAQALPNISQIHLRETENLHLADAYFSRAHKCRARSGQASFQVSPEIKGNYCLLTSYSRRIVLLLCILRRLLPEVVLSSKFEVLSRSLLHVWLQ